MINRRSILRHLTKARLHDIAANLGVAGNSRASKEELVVQLAKSPVKTRVLLESVSRKDLRLICSEFNLSVNGGNKADFVRALMHDVESQQLKSGIRNSLKGQGFSVHRDRIDLPADPNKDDLRDIHALAVRHRVEKSRPGLVRYQKDLLLRVANGSDVVPEKIEPVLVPVESDSRDELLFRFASLHWSIPVSSGYGRRLRFLVVDQANDKLIGIIGLGDPVFSLAARDKWIGWGKDARAERLQNVMDAFVLGAVPPYSQLLCGKLVASFVTSNEVRDAFKRKYDRRKSIIREKQLSARLALVTTTSALGRSSIYNRLKHQGRLAFESVGFTQGSGEFQFFNGVYDQMTQFAENYLEPSAKHGDWGTGFRNRREVVRKCLADVGLAAEWLYHGIRREIFVAPLAQNTKEFLCGEHSRLRWHNQTADDLFRGFRERWLLPRAEWDDRFLNFEREAYRLW